MQPGGSDRDCVVCEKSGHFRCKRCGTHYCSPACQKKDWNEGHHAEVCRVIDELCQARTQCDLCQNTTIYTLSTTRGQQVCPACHWKERTVYDCQMCGKPRCTPRPPPDNVCSLCLEKQRTQLQLQQCPCHDPELVEQLATTRKHYPSGRIAGTTIGKLLLQQKSQWCDGCQTFLCDQCFRPKQNRSDNIGICVPFCFECQDVDCSRHERPKVKAPSGVYQCYDCLMERMT